MRLLQLKEEGQVQTWDEVALLFRASTGYADYETALEEASIPFVTVAGRGFYDRPEIRDLINILRALADPLDDLAFAGLLRSPAFGLSDSALFLLRQSGLPYWEALQADLSVLNTQDCERAHRTLEIVSQLLPLVDRIPVAELLPKIVNATQYRAILAAADVKDNSQGASTTGGRLWRNLDKLLADALARELRVRNYLDMIETLNGAVLAKVKPLLKPREPYSDDHPQSQRTGIQSGHPGSRQAGAQIARRTGVPVRGTGHGVQT